LFGFEGVHIGNVSLQTCVGNSNKIEVYELVFSRKKPLQSYIDVRALTGPGIPGKYLECYSGIFQDCKVLEN